MSAGQPTLARSQQAARCGDRLERVKLSVLERCAVDAASFNEYAIPLQDSVDVVRAELRQTAYLAKPGGEVEYLQGMGGVYLHPDFVNFDVTCGDNQDAFRTQMVGGGGDRESVVLPDDDILEMLCKAELITRFTAAISALCCGQEREMRLRAMRRAKTKAAIIAMSRESLAEAEEVCSSESAVQCACRMYVYEND